MIILDKVQKKLETLINDLLDDGDGWENWYPKYYSCDNVAFVQYVFAWIEFGEAGIYEKGVTPDRAWKAIRNDYEGDLTSALVDVLEIAIKVHKENFK